MAAASSTEGFQSQDMDHLLKACPFDPNDIKPELFDFAPHMVDKKEKAKDKVDKADKEDKKGESAPSTEGQARQRLPHRLRLTAFSRSVGHRPMGLQVAQVRLFTQRFPTDFREMSMQKMVLPCNVEGTLPFVAKDGLPCPALSTVNALRWLEQKRDQLKEKGDFRAIQQIERIFNRGVQVEWIECESFLQWQLYVETSSVQASVQVAPHVLDTAMKYLTFCRSPRAACLGAEPSDGDDLTEGKVDEKFGQYLQGKSVHRLKEAKTLLRACSPSVLVAMAQWRKNVHYLHANSLAQSYLISCEEWTALLNKSVMLEQSSFGLQDVVAKQVMQMISESEIVVSGEVPKLKKNIVTIHVFKELCTTALQVASTFVGVEVDLLVSNRKGFSVVVSSCFSYHNHPRGSSRSSIAEARQGSKYKAFLENQFASVWSTVPSAEKVFKRLIVSGEPTLRQTFLRGLAVSGKVENLDFQMSDPTSDWAQIVERMESAVAVLKAEEERKAAEQAEAAKKVAEEAALRAAEAAREAAKAQEGANVLSQEMEAIFAGGAGVSGADASAQGQISDHKEMSGGEAAGGGTEGKEEQKEEKTEEGRMRVKEENRIRIEKG